MDSTVADRGIKIGRTIQCLGGWLDLCRLESGEWRESLVEEKTVVVAVVGSHLLYVSTTELALARNVYGIVN